MLNNTNPVLRRSVTAPVNTCNVAAAEDAMMQHTREYNGVFRPAFVTRWSSFVDIGVDKRYELGTWTTKEARRERRRGFTLHARRFQRDEGDDELSDERIRKYIERAERYEHLSH